jgi:F0F1-type ATP synthase assembly protein I
MMIDNEKRDRRLSIWAALCLGAFLGMSLFGAPSWGLVVLLLVGGIVAGVLAS